MILSIIFIILFAFFIYRAYNDYYNREGYIFLVIVIFIISLSHFVPITLKSYSYKLLLAERGAIQQTLNDSRINSTNSFENATITKNVMLFNNKLAQDKISSQNFWFSCYFDKRILDIEYVK